MKTVVTESLEKNLIEFVFSKKKKKLLNTNSEFSQEKWQKKLRISKATWRVCQELKARETFDFYCPPGIPSSADRFIYQERWEKQNYSESPIESNMVN